MNTNLVAIRSTVALILGATPLLGCDSGSSGGGTAGSVTLAQFPAEYAQAVCAQNFKCAPAGDIGTHTMQQCVDDTSTGLSLFATLISSGQASNRVAYDGAKMRTCVTTLTQLTCDDWKKGLALPNQPDTCKAAIAAKVGPGGACQQDIECTTTHCEGSDTSANPPVDGKCTALLAVGVSCTDSSSCADGLYCESVSGKCVAQKPAGQPCTSDEVCVNSCNLTASPGVCSAYVGCAVGGSGPRASTLSLVAVATILLLVGRRRGRA